MGYQVHKIRLSNNCIKAAVKKEKDAIPASHLVDQILVKCKKFTADVVRQQERGTNPDNEVYVELNNVVFRDEIDKFINKEKLTSKYHSQLMLTHDDFNVIMFEQHRTEKNKQTGEIVKYVARITLFSKDHYDELKAAVLEEEGFLYKILDTKEVD